MKKIVMMLVCVFLVICVTGCGLFPFGVPHKSGDEPSASSGDNPAVSTEEPQNIIVLEEGVRNELKVGDFARIVLSENPTTGYIWFFEITGDDIAEVVSDKYTMDQADEMMDGVGGVRVITLKMIAPGEAAINMVNKRGDDDVYYTTGFSLFVSGDPLPVPDTGGDKELAEKLANSKRIIEPFSITKVRTGQVVHIMMGEVQSIPCRWHAGISDTNLIELIADTVGSGGNSNNKPGGGDEVHIFYFEALRSGEAMIFMYGLGVDEEPDEDSKPEYTYTIRISDS